MKFTGMHYSLMVFVGFVISVGDERARSIKTLQIHVCEERCVMVPVLYHKIAELANCLPSHCLVSSSSAARG